jgi:hypothetical protein
MVGARGWARLESFPAETQDRLSPLRALASSFVAAPGAGAPASWSSPGAPSRALMVRRREEPDDFARVEAVLFAARSR